MMGCIIIMVTLIISVKLTPLGRRIVIYTKIDVKLVKMTLGVSIGGRKAPMSEKMVVNLTLRVVNLMRMRVIQRI